MRYALDVLDKRGMGMLCAMVWGLWHKRNAWVIRKKKLDFAQVMAKALSVFATQEWVPPLDSKVKVNFAVSAIEDVGTGFGVIFRNSKAETMASGTILFFSYFLTIFPFPFLKNKSLAIWVWKKKCFDKVWIQVLSNL